MVRNKAKSVLFIFLSVVVMGAEATSTKKMYRWVNDDNKVFFSDQMPPDQVKHRRETLNKNARVIDVVEQEKTKAQQALEKRLTKLRIQQQAILQKQRIKDKVLLTTFRNLQDMDLALKGKMLALDRQRRVVQGNLNRLNKQLRQQQQRAAQHERDGRKVPKNINNDISSSKMQIEMTLIEISKKFENKRNIRRIFEEDIARFTFLTQSTVSSKDLTRKTAESKAETELGVYICETKKICDKAWVYAKQFVSTYSTTGLYVETDRLIMSQDPSKNTDLSLSASMMDVENNKQQLFLDIRCHISSLGKDLCAGVEARHIRHSFSDYIKSALKAEI